MGKVRLTYRRIFSLSLVLLLLLLVLSLPFLLLLLFIVIELFNYCLIGQLIEPHIEIDGD